MSANTNYTGGGGSLQGPKELKRRTNDEKKKTYQVLRSEAAALKNAIIARNQLGVWDPSTRFGTEKSREFGPHLGRDIASLLAYFENIHSPALDVISRDRFTLRYQVHGDIDREAVMGANTVTINVPVKWEKLEVGVKLYPGELDKLMSQPKLASHGRTGIPNRDDVAKNTGWNRNDVRNFPDHRMYALQSLLDNMGTGQSKITRLVKGFLLLNEVRDRGGLDVQIGHHTHVAYAAGPVVDSYEIAGRSYAYNSRPTARSHAAVLLTMCRAYPPPQYASHVTVPADGDEICLVSQGMPTDAGAAVTLTEGLVYSSIITYALDTSCSGLLQQAQIIACSLQENRYFSKVSLPAVVSMYDLMIPAFVNGSSTLQNAMLSSELSRSVGRIHQMLGFTAAKDVIVASNYQAKQGFDPSSSIKAYLNSNADLVQNMASKMSGIGILGATPKLKLFKDMETADYADLLNISIFESFWLVRAESSVNNGVIGFLKDGERLRIPESNAYDVLVEELVLAGVTVEHRKLPDGAFTTTWVSVLRNNHQTPKRRARVSLHTNLVRACEFNPGMNLKGQGRKARGTVATVTREPPSGIPLTQVFKTPSPKRPRQVAPSPPPPYPERSSSPITESSEGMHVREESLFAAEEMEEPPLARTAIARQAVNRFKKSTLERVLEETEKADVNNLKVQEKKNEFILASLAKDDPQFNGAEQLDNILRKGGLGGRERGAWSSLIKRHLTIQEAVGATSIEQLVVMLTATGLKGEGEILAGNNKFTKIINASIKGNNPVKFEDSEPVRMRKEGDLWTGHITELSRPGLGYVSASAAFQDWLENYGVHPSEELYNGTVARWIGRYLMGNPTYELSEVTKLWLWTEGTTVNALPTDISADDLPEEIPDELNWRKESTSLGVREFNKEDSRWLYLACLLPAGKFQMKILKQLCSEFVVPRELQQMLREKYGLFEGRK